MFSLATLSAIGRFVRYLSQIGLPAAGAHNLRLRALAKEENLSKPITS
jgi:hypothetical protein